jgi:hypothetical protein
MRNRQSFGASLMNKDFGGSKQYAKNEAISFQTYSAACYQEGMNTNKHREYRIAFQDSAAWNSRTARIYLFALLNVAPE